METYIPEEEIQIKVSEDKKIDYNLNPVTLEAVGYPGKRRNK